MFKNLILIIFVLFAFKSIANDRIFIYCNSTSYPLEVDAELFSSFNFNSLMEARDFTTNYRTRSLMRRTNFACNHTDFCFEGRDYLYYYKLNIPRSVFPYNTNIRFFRGDLEIRDQRNNRYRRDFLRCRKF